MTVAVPKKNLADWHSPETRPEVIHELIHGVDRYNPTNLPYMEEYLLSQIKEGQYDLFANLAILKLYQFNPQHSNPDIIIHILIKSLSSTVHGPDFNLSLGLLREPTAILHDIESDDESLSILVPYLTNLHDLIRTCQFTKFWTEFNGDSEAANILKSRFLPSHAHPIDDLRLQFSLSIASCFSSITLTQLSRWLNLNGSEVNEWIEKVGWTFEGEKAIIPKNGDNDVKAGVVKENVQLNQLTKLVAAAAY
ncbi:eukaryotic translation initiation factor 3 subunit K [Kwoniella pini CBS 10737]|uniref:Eukaryotic translation initiation factor 3 subunit K n=1 Tax=Kwoniella pini CBS 10737 TaxID=1296096 RepID=A0A1B9I7Q5_9TREE|nr:eukaryotic translation initiation factor 3 subunit K [Kwoniella pini CBS 10737]OCF51597.1 eukaryotic translation initiation factor 3 subunit K [Kwoniella pini CBS 10737]